MKISIFISLSRILYVDVATLILEKSPLLRYFLRSVKNKIKVIMVTLHLLLMYVDVATLTLAKKSQLLKIKKKKR